MRTRRLGVLCFGLLLGSTLAGGAFGGRVLAGTSRLSEHLRLYTAILSTIEEHYAEEVPTDRLITTSIREMLRTLDPHSNFLETKEYGQLQERQKGSYYGLGITVNAVDGRITVVAPFEGTPAHRLGIRAGDVISRIGDEDARGMSIDDAVKRLRGPKGTSVRIAVLRQGYDEPLEFTVIRDEIPLHSVPFFFMLEGEVGYVRLIDFNETTACEPGEAKDCERELERALRRLQKEGAKAFVLDIRDNPGGLLNQAFAVSNLFLRKGQLVVFTRGRNKRDESNYVTERESPWAAVPLVVLVSRHSASASEIVAGAIQDHDRGLTVGETTFGKGLVQTIMPLRNSRGYALALTTGRYYTPSGRSIQRDYGATSLDDYFLPRGRQPCEQGGGEAKLTDAGRRVYGGDGITPDFCVETPQAPRFVAHLIARQAFVGFSGRFTSAAVQGSAQLSGAGSRSEAQSAKVRPVDREFRADDRVMGEFRAFLEERKIRFTQEELAAHRVEIGREIEEEVLRQVFGEADARRRTLAWDPQIQKALEVVSQAEVLMKDPQRFIAERERGSQTASLDASR